MTKLKNKFDVDDVVFAKMHRYPYWPAKVVSVRRKGSRTKYCVTFFGPFHSTGTVTENNICPYGEFKHVYGAAKVDNFKNAGFNAALREVEAYLRALKTEAEGGSENADLRCIENWKDVERTLAGNGDGLGDKARCTEGLKGAAHEMTESLESLENKACFTQDRKGAGLKLTGSLDSLEHKTCFMEDRKTDRGRATTGSSESSDRYPNSTGDSAYDEELRGLPSSAEDLVFSPDNPDRLKPRCFEPMSFRSDITSPPGPISSHQVSFSPLSDHYLEHSILDDVAERLQKYEDLSSMDVETSLALAAEAGSALLRDNEDLRTDLARLREDNDRLAKLLWEERGTNERLKRELEDLRGENEASSIDEQIIAELSEKVVKSRKEIDYLRGKIEAESQAREELLETYEAERVFFAQRSGDLESEIVRLRRCLEEDEQSDLELRGRINGLMGRIEDLESENELLKKNTTDRQSASVEGDLIRNETNLQEELDKKNCQIESATLKQEKDIEDLMRHIDDLTSSETDLRRELDEKDGLLLNITSKQMEVLAKMAELEEFLESLLENIRNILEVERVASDDFARIVEDVLPHLGDAPIEINLAEFSSSCDLSKSVENVTPYSVCENIPNVSKEQELFHQRVSDETVGTCDSAEKSHRRRPISAYDLEDGGEFQDLFNGEFDKCERSDESVEDSVFEEDHTVTDSSEAPLARYEHVGWCDRGPSAAPHPHSHSQSQSQSSMLLKMLQAQEEQRRMQQQQQQQQQRQQGEMQRRAYNDTWTPWESLCSGAAPAPPSPCPPAHPPQPPQSPLWGSNVWAPPPPPDTWAPPGLAPRPPPRLDDPANPDAEPGMEYDPFRSLCNIWAPHSAGPNNFWKPPTTN